MEGLPSDVLENICLYLSTEQHEILLSTKGKIFLFLRLPGYRIRWYKKNNFMHQLIYKIPFEYHSPKLGYLLVESFLHLWKNKITCLMKDSVNNESSIDDYKNIVYRLNEQEVKSIQLSKDFDEVISLHRIESNTDYACFRLIQYSIYRGYFKAIEGLVTLCNEQNYHLIKLKRLVSDIAAIYWNFDIIKRFEKFNSLTYAYYTFIDLNELEDSAEQWEDFLTQEYFEKYFRIQNIKSKPRAKNWDSILKDQVFKSRMVNLAKRDDLNCYLIFISLIFIVHFCGDLDNRKYEEEFGRLSVQYLNRRKFRLNVVDLFLDCFIVQLTEQAESIGIPKYSLIDLSHRLELHEEFHKLIAVV